MEKAKQKDKQKLMMIEIKKIKEPKRVARTESLGINIGELAASIRDHGVIEPIVLQRAGEGFEVIVGHRRLLAAKIAGLVEIPAVLRDEKEDEIEALKLHENLYREDMTQIEEAEYYTRLMKEYGMTEARIGEIIGKTRSYVNQRVMIYKWPDELREGLKQKKITFTACLKLMEIKDTAARDYYVHAAVESGANVPTCEMWAHAANAPQPPPSGGSAAAGPAAAAQPAGKYLPACWACEEHFEQTEMHFVQLCNKCVVALKEAIEAAEELSKVKEV